MVMAHPAVETCDSEAIPKGRLDPANLQLRKGGMPPPERQPRDWLGNWAGSVGL